MKESNPWTLNDVGWVCILGGFITLLGAWMIMFITSYWIQYLVPIHLFVIGAIILKFTENKDKEAEVKI